MWLFVDNYTKVVRYTISKSLNSPLSKVSWLQCMRHAWSHLGFVWTRTKARLDKKLQQKLLNATGKLTLKKKCLMSEKTNGIFSNCGI